jgi:hypothetical protein
VLGVGLHKRAHDPCRADVFRTSEKFFEVDISGWLHGWGSNATARRSATNQIDHDLFRSLTAENPKDRSVVLGIEHFSTAARRLADADAVCQGAV